MKLKNIQSQRELQRFYNFNSKIDGLDYQLCRFIQGYDIKESVLEENYKNIIEESGSLVMNVTHLTKIRLKLSEVTLNLFAAKIDITKRNKN